MQVNSRKNNFVYNKISGGLGVFRIFVARAKYEGGVRTWSFALKSICPFTSYFQTRANT